MCLIVDVYCLQPKPSPNSNVSSLENIQNRKTCCSSSLVKSLQVLRLAQIIFSDVIDLSSVLDAAAVARYTSTIFRLVECWVVIVESPSHSLNFPCFSFVYLSRWLQWDKNAIVNLASMDFLIFLLTDFSWTFSLLPTHILKINLKCACEGWRRGRM